MKAKEFIKKFEKLIEQKFKFNKAAGNSSRDGIDTSGLKNAMVANGGETKSGEPVTLAMGLNKKGEWEVIVSSAEFEFEKKVKDQKAAEAEFSKLKTPFSDKSFDNSWKRAM